MITAVLFFIIVLAKIMPEINIPKKFFQYCEIGLKNFNYKPLRKIWIVYLDIQFFSFCPNKFLNSHFWDMSATPGNTLYILDKENQSCYIN